MYHCNQELCGACTTKYLRPGLFVTEHHLACHCGNIGKYAYESERPLKCDLLWTGGWPLTVFGPVSSSRSQTHTELSSTILRGSPAIKPNPPVVTAFCLSETGSGKRSYEAVFGKSQHCSTLHRRFRHQVKLKFRCLWWEVKLCWK